MNIRSFSLIALLSFSLLAGSCGGEQQPAAAPAAPKITLSADTLIHKDFIKMYGSGFTPKVEALSHLKRPDGREFPVLPILTNDKGEFTHEIDSLLLLEGTHELWVFDGGTGVSSNVAKFDVTYGQAPLK